MRSLRLKATSTLKTAMAEELEQFLYLNVLMGKKASLAFVMNPAKTEQRLRARIVRTREKEIKKTMSDLERARLKNKSVQVIRI